MTTKTKAGKAGKGAPKGVDELTVGQRKARQLAKYRGTYKAYVRNGGVSLDNGDDVALLLRTADLAAVLRAADAVAGQPAGFHAARYEARNPGAKRMNAGNVIRGALKRGDATVADLKKALR